MMLFWFVIFMAAFSLFHFKLWEGENKELSAKLSKVEEQLMASILYLEQQVGELDGRMVELRSRLDSIGQEDIGIDESLSAIAAALERTPKP